MRPTFILALVFLAASLTRADAIDDLIKAEMGKQHIPGLSLVVARGGAVMKSAAYGQASLEWSIPATPQTVFQIQSITRTFTATAILMLLQERIFIPLAMSSTRIVNLSDVIPTARLDTACAMSKSRPNRAHGRGHGGTGPCKRPISCCNKGGLGARCGRLPSAHGNRIINDQDQALG